MAKAEAPAQGDSGKVQAEHAHGAEARAADARFAPPGAACRPEVKGVIVTDVADDSPLADIGVEPGDVIESPSISSR